MLGYYFVGKNGRRVECIVCGGIGELPCRECGWVPKEDLAKIRAVTLKKLAEFWATQSALTGVKPTWWKRAYIYVLFKISPPRVPEDMPRPK
jgi:hypothetical protein